MNIARVCVLFCTCTAALILTGCDYIQAAENARKAKNAAEKANQKYEQLEARVNGLEDQIRLLSEMSERENRRAARFQALLSHEAEH